MKILHTSDWHLGKKLYKKERVEEHTLFLQWLIKEIKNQEIEVLVIAGDIFDTPIPTTTSLTLFFQFLKELEELSIEKGGTLEKVLILAGNHDSAKLLESPRPFLNKDFIKVVGTLRPPKELTKEAIEHWQNEYIVRLKKEGAVFSFCLLPFFRTREIMDNPWLREHIATTQNTYDINETLLLSLKIFLAQLHNKTGNGHKKETFEKPWQREENCQGEKNQEKIEKILVSHHLFGSFLTAGSEQSVALSGLDSIPLSLFEEWKLLLLGHIHKPQVVKNEPLAVYCGSPIPLRFSESNQKQVLTYEWDSKTNTFTKNSVEIPIFRPLVRIKTTKENFKEDILRALAPFSAKEQKTESPLNAFLEVSIQSFSSLVLQEIREFICDLPVELLNYYGEVQQENTEEKKDVNIATLTGKSTEELFELFLEQHAMEEKEKKDLLQNFSKLLQEQYIELYGNPEEDNNLEEKTLKATGNDSQEGGL